MKGTKSKILRAARFLFNNNGVANVSQRNISDHIAISPGNLTYHFKKRDDIIAALYEEMGLELETHLANLKKEHGSFESFFTFTRACNKTFFENQFFLNDLIDILRSNKKIKKEHEKWAKQRSEYLKDFINDKIEKGELRKAEFETEYDDLQQRIQLVSDFWVASIGNMKEDLMLKHSREYSELILRSFYPYLTEKGKKEFQEVMK